MNIIILLHDMIQEILIRLGCNRLLYRALVNFYSTDKHWNKFIKSKEFNGKYSQLYNCTTNSYKRSCNLINGIKSGAYNYKYNFSLKIYFSVKITN